MHELVQKVLVARHFLDLRPSRRVLEVAFHHVKPRIETRLAHAVKFPEPSPHCSAEPFALGYHCVHFADVINRFDEVWQLGENVLGDELPRVLETSD